jgi:hypothetical protein
MNQKIHDKDCQKETSQVFPFAYEARPPYGEQQSSLFLIGASSAIISTGMINAALAVCGIFI